MLATPGPVPEGDGWAYEFKWDGVRVITAVAGGNLQAQSRNDKPLADMYPELGALRDLVDQAVTLDGEVVALDKQGRPDFGLLQQRMHRHNPPAELLQDVPVLYYVFDVLHVDGEDLTRLTYTDRREALAGLGLNSDAVKVPPCFVGVEGATIQATAAEHGLEGVVAKRVTSRYEPGKRSRSWIKTPLRRNVEVIVGGWAPGQGRRASTLGALLLGVPSPKGLTYIGNCGTGFTDSVLAELFHRLTELEQPRSPFAEPVPNEFARHAHWVAPEIVGEVEYRSVSRDGRLRHPSWRGVRDDKSASDLPLNSLGPDAT